MCESIQQNGAGFIEVKSVAGESDVYKESGI